MVQKNCHTPEKEPTKEINYWTKLIDMLSSAFIQRKGHIQFSYNESLEDELVEQHRFTNNTNNTKLEETKMQLTTS
jgi:uncharacterized protein YdhG (YjbR/CyaY superfamily)